MCGIVGFFGPGDGGLLENLTEQLRHRGPDGQGLFVDHRLRIFLGHRRLAIRDVAGGAQPMVVENERYVLTYNGEIYNDQILRSKLQDLGHHFATRSDTEVVLRSLIQWGQDALVRFDGQFALCFVDRTKGTVILARDRFGEKPIYWAKVSGGVVFASESSVLVQHPSIRAALDQENCTRYLIMGYLPPPFSILKGIRQLLPGHCLCFSLSERLEVSERRFASPWDHTEGQVLNRGKSFGIDTIDRAVASRSVSDVPLGILLSGGVDSSLIAASAKRNGFNPQTYTLGFEDSSYDESEFAKGVAEKLQLANEQRKLTHLEDSSILRTLETLDEPLGDPSYLPTYETYALAKQSSRVLLTGDGGDELFFGYEPFRALNLARKIRRVIPKVVSEVFAEMVSHLPRGDSYMNKLEVAERFFDGLHYEGAVQVLVWMSTLRVNEWPRFFTGSPCPETVFSFARGLDYALPDDQIVRHLFLSAYLPGSILSKSDRASMAHSVESRSVLLHPEVVSHAVSLTSKDEIRRGMSKQSLRRVVTALGLKDVATRKKHGFAMPLAEILRRSSLTAPQLEVESVRQDRLDQEWNHMRQGRPARVQFLWSALALARCRSYQLVTA